MFHLPPPLLAFLIDGLGGSEVMMLLFLVLILFGGQRLPEFARGLGKSIREFKKATAGVESEIKKAIEPALDDIRTPPPPKPILPPSPPLPPPTEPEEKT